MSWCVCVGKKNGKRDIRNFDSQNKAISFANEWNAKIVESNAAGLADLSNLQRHEVLAALERLKPYNATIPEAVDFFIRFARPEKGQITISDAIRYFLEQKARAHRSADYLRNCEKTFYKPFEKAFPNRMLTSITSVEAEKYIHSHGDWNATTTASHIQYLNTFYRFLIRKKYAKLNPFGELDAPRRVDPKAKTLTVEQAKTLLQFALDNGYKAECAAMVLVFFCAVRVDEVGRCGWEQVDLAKLKVRLEGSVTKKARRRVTEIPPNAAEWLKLCKDKGRIAPNDYRQRMKRLRRRAEAAHPKLGEYPQNAMRHCFAGYHLAKYKNSHLAAALLGHTNAALLYRHYFECVTEEAGEEYWNIVPDSVALSRAKQAQHADEQARIEAEEQSNCGRAERDEHGKWYPVMDDPASAISNEIAVESDFAE